jgi:glycosyltransferase involved in cell wall biosynthesis
VTRRRRILYVQYSNPAGYPPLINSALLLAERGWDVLVLGTGAIGTADLSFPAHERIRVRRLGFMRAGPWQKLHYALFVAWAWLRALAFRADWVYVSDPLAAPVGLLASALPRTAVLYHEHDSPGGAGSGFFRLVLGARRRLARRAELCVLPNAQRAVAFRNDTGRTGPTHCVWNCPRLAEVAPSRAPFGEALTLYYHGSLSAQFLPPTLLEALAQLPEAVQLSVVGYETVGSAGFMRDWLARAAQLGVAGRVRFHGAVDRAQALRLASAADVGLVLLPPGGGDFNLEHLVGASNKAFDYLAVGLTLLVTARPDWHAAYVDAGFALDCDPRDPASLVRAVRECLERRAETQARGERGRQKVLQDWNYEKQFGPVLRHLEGG